MTTKELLFNALANIDKLKSSVIINRMLNYDPNSLTKLTPVITISVSAERFSLVITDKSTCSFSITTGEDVFKSNFYCIECEGLFKEVYNSIKHLLLIEV